MLDTGSAEGGVVWELRCNIAALIQPVRDITAVVPFLLRRGRTPVQSLMPAPPAPGDLVVTELAKAMVLRLLLTVLNQESQRPRLAEFLGLLHVAYASALRQRAMSSTPPAPPADGYISGASISTSKSGQTAESGAGAFDLLNSRRRSLASGTAAEAMAAAAKAQGLLGSGSVQYTGFTPKQGAV